MSKVFIIYPHNPQPYVYLSPTDAEELRRRHPEKSDNEISEMRVQEAASSANVVKKRINNHNEQVDRFAKFLKTNGVDVAYEGLLQDKSTKNYMRWFQDQLKKSDFIILIITESFNYFLSDQKFPHDGQEQIFEGEFLHNLVHQPTKPLLPVFLGHPKNLDLLPDVLKCSSTYHVRDTPDFSVLQSEMDSLYAVLTKQNRFELPPRGAVVELPKRGRFVPGKSQQQRRANPLMASELHQRMYTSLRDCPRPLTSMHAATLSEKTGFAKHWTRLTCPLYLSDAEVERIKYQAEESERCFQVLLHWVEKQEKAATVAKLAEVVWLQCQDAVMLKILYDVCII